MKQEVSKGKTQGSGDFSVVSSLVFLQMKKAVWQGQPSELPWILVTYLCDFEQLD